MIFGLVSAKGAPGATTTALAMAASAGGVLVELDPTGGSVECWTGAADEPGLLRAASGLRRAPDPSALLSFVTEPVPGCRALLAPTAGPLAEATISALAGRLVPALSEVEHVVVIDGGRWAPSQPTADRISGCDVVGLVCNPTVESVEAVRWLIEPLRSAVDRVEVVMVGDRPHRPDEVASAIGAARVGVVTWDRRGLGMLLRQGFRRGWLRSSLARSANSLVSWFEDVDGDGRTPERPGLSHA